MEVARRLMEPDVPIESLPVRQPDLVRGRPRLLGTPLHLVGARRGDVIGETGTHHRRSINDSAAPHEPRGLVGEVDTRDQGAARARIALAWIAGGQSHGDLVGRPAGDTVHRLEAVTL